MTEGEDDVSGNPLDIDIGGGSIMFLCLHWFVWVLVLILLECVVFKYFKPKGKSVPDDKEKGNADKDVAEEERQVLNNENDYVVKAE